MHPILSHVFFSTTLFSAKSSKIFLFFYCGRVCKHDLRKRISKCEHLWCICTKSFELLSLIKLFGPIILFWNHTFRCTSLKKMNFSKCILHVSKWRRIIFKLSVFHVSNCISILKFTHQHLSWNLKSSVEKPITPKVVPNINKVNNNYSRFFSLKLLPCFQNWLGRCCRHLLYWTWQIFYVSTE